MLCVLIRIAPSRRLSLHSIYHYFIEDQKDIHILFPFVSWPGAMINPQWLELLISGTNFHGSKDVRVIETLLYVHIRQKICVMCDS